MFNSIMNIISRKEAKSQGLKRYFTGKPCKRGHIAERGVCNSGCISCKQQRIKENPERESEYYRRWYQSNIEMGREKSRRWAKSNPEKARKKARRWYQTNPEKGKAKSHLQRARRNNAKGSHTAADIRWLLDKQNYKCIYCKKSLKKEYHIDHIIALFNGGDNTKNNLQLLCPKCNLSKGAKNPIAFAQEKGLLL